MAKSEESTTADVVTKTARTKPSRRPSKSQRNILGFSRGPHDALCRLLRKSGARSVLEIGVGDGSRAVAVVNELARQAPIESIRYAAVDPFELAKGAITLKCFHRLMRAQQIRPRLFPSTLSVGLHRAANTIGAVDVVLIAQDDSDSNPDWNRLLAKLTHSETIVLRHSGEAWDRLPSPGARKSRLRQAA